MFDNVYFLLQYLNNWDSYGLYIGSAPLSESRKVKYEEIIEQYRKHELDGNGVISTLVVWLANFDRINREKFLDWVANQKL